MSEVGTDAGSLAGLFEKHVKGAGVVPQESLWFVAGQGIEGDINAGSASPRQVTILCESHRDLLGVEPGALRENVLLCGVDPGRLTSGSVVQIGSAVLRVTFECEPCGFAVKTTGWSLRDLHGLRGHLAVVIESGAVSLGDPVTVAAGGFLALADTEPGRVQQTVDAIPEGQWITYADLVTSVGAPSSAVRAVPRWLQKLPLGTAVHRVLPVSGVPTGDEQRDRLHSEGVLDAGVARGDCRWQFEQMFYEVVASPPG